MYQGSNSPICHVICNAQSTSCEFMKYFTYSEYSSFNPFLFFKMVRPLKNYCDKEMNIPPMSHNSQKTKW